MQLNPTFLKIQYTEDSFGKQLLVLNGILIKTLTMINQHQFLNFRLNLYLSAFIILVFTACDNDDDDNTETSVTAGGYSITLADNSPLISGYGWKHGVLASRFWVDTESVDANTFDTNVPNQTLYRSAMMKITEKTMSTKTRKVKINTINSIRAA